MKLLCTVIWAFVLFLAYPDQGFAKICTNAIADGVSHTFRSQYLRALDSENQSSYMYYKHSAVITNHGHGHARRIIKEQGVHRSNSFLEASSLHKVSLASGSPQGIAQQTNLEYLLLLDVDRLVYSFRINAALSASGSPYGGWEKPDSELRGHFVGHYLSAAALMWASTHNESLHEKMDAVVDALAECQNKVGTGYLSAFPTSFFDRFEALEPVWAPYYTIHKIMAGLVDQYIYAKNEKAFTMVLKMANYFSNRVHSVIRNQTIERHWQSLNEETGGMNDVLYQIYKITGNDEHLELAHLFDKPCFLGLLAVEADSLSGFHSNTHIPIVVGAQMRFELTGDGLYKNIARFFMDIVNSSHVYATGGTSNGEYWSDPKRLASTLGTEDEESCTTYNMLKVARNLFRWTKEMPYVDYYERAILNAILTTQRGNEPGVMLYMLPLAPGSSKAKSYHGWGTKYDSFWCCYGTGIESFSKLGDSIYFEETGAGAGAGLYIVQFVSSTLIWDSVGLKLEQTVQSLTSYDSKLKVTLSFAKADLQPVSGAISTLHVRLPFWAAAEGCQAVLNGVELQLPSPGNFLEIQRKWSSGDNLSLVFRATIRTERIADERPEYGSVNAIFFGPYLLAGLSKGDWKMGPVNISSPSDWVVPVHPSYAEHLYTFEQRVSKQEGMQSMGSQRKSMLEIEDQAIRWVLSYADGHISMVAIPSEGTDQALHSTFRLASPVVLRDAADSKQTSNYDGTKASELVYKVVSLELVSRPGSFLSHNGISQNLTVTDYYYQHRLAEEHDSRDDRDLKAVFQVLPGLSGERESVSFEAAGLPGCFLLADRCKGKQAAAAVQLQCKQGGGNESFDMASSFLVKESLSSYHPMSFIAYGTNRSYLLFPLNAYKDEHYSVYFDMK